MDVKHLTQEEDEEKRHPFCSGLRPEQTQNQLHGPQAVEEPRRTGSGHRPGFPEESEVPGLPDPGLLREFGVDDTAPLITITGRGFRSSRRRVWSPTPFRKGGSTNTPGWLRSVCRGTREERSFLVYFQTLGKGRPR